MSDNRKEEIKEKLSEIAKDLKKVGKKVAKKTVKITDAASARIKLQSVSVKLSAEYEELGKLSYSKLVRDVDNADKIASSIDKIDELRTEIAVLKKELSEKLQKINEEDDEKSE